MLLSFIFLENVTLGNNFSCNSGEKIDEDSPLLLAI
jgi:hypothetical protein